MKECSRPPGIFRGENFMTPDVRGYYEVKGGWVELAHGLGFRSEPIYGVTFRDAEQKDPDEHSTLFHSRREALEFIEALTDGN